MNWTMVLGLWIERWHATLVPDLGGGRICSWGMGWSNIGATMTKSSPDGTTGGVEKRPVTREPIQGEWRNKEGNLPFWRGRQRK